MRLIDADELKHGLCVECTLYPDNCLKEDCDWNSIYHIEHAPTIEAEPRKHGHWKFTFRALRSVPVDADITCSVCGATFNRTFGTRFIYCPHCGAMMDEVEE